MLLKQIILIKEIQEFTISNLMRGWAPKCLEMSQSKM